jgi:hypothetical protein
MLRLLESIYSRLIDFLKVAPPPSLGSETSSTSQQLKKCPDGPTPDYNGNCPSPSHKEIESTNNNNPPTNSPKSKHHDDSGSNNNK